MAISYNIYANDGRGGRVDYDKPIATTPDLTYTIGPLAFPSDNTFAVRAFDLVSSIEEANTDARIRIIIDATGNDVTSQPNAVIGLSVRPTAGGTCWVSWGYNETGQRCAPARFNVTLTPASSVAGPALPVAYLPGVAGYGCSLSGLSSNTFYNITVSAVGNLNGLAGPTSMVSLTYQVAPLSDVDALVATPSA